MTLGQLAVLLSTALAMTVTSAQTDLQRAQNLVTCLSGNYPSLCKQAWLSTDERAKAEQAERRENLRTCMTGRFPSLCQKSRLSPEEAKQVSLPIAARGAT